MPVLTTSRWISSTGSPARALRSRAGPRAAFSLSSPSTSPATSSRRSPGRGSRTRTGSRARAPGRGDGGLLRARGRDASSRPATAGTRRRTSAAPGRQARHNLALLAGPRLPRPRDRSRLDGRRPALAERAEARRRTSPRSPPGAAPPRELERLDAATRIAGAAHARPAPGRARAVRGGGRRRRRRRRSSGSSGSASPSGVATGSASRAAAVSWAARVTAELSLKNPCK